jgi:ATP-dependent exoDNAse (exonuclease V) beta subunit
VSGERAFPEAVRPLFRLEAPTALSAGAGSGKTTAVVELVVRLLSGEALGAPCGPAEIAAITFTERAADELAERLREAVAARARAAAAAHPGSEEVAAWLERLHGLDRMAVGTIHGFAGRILREHAVEAGLDPEFQVIDEERASARLGEACRAAVVAALDAGTPAVAELVAGLGAGGEGEGLSALVASLARGRATRGDAGPPRVAAGSPEAVRRAREELSAAARALHAARGLARTEGAREIVAAVSAALGALEPGDLGGPVGPGALRRLAALAGAARGRLAASDGELRAHRDALVEAAEAFSAEAAELLAGPQAAALAALVVDAEGRYRADKRAERAVDFDDLLVLARDVLRRDAPLRAELRGRLRAFLVDEYQDVNALQQEIFDLLAGPGDPPGPVLVGVGDAKQSIYRFRGADVGVFARLLARLEGGEGRVLALPQNHRSAPALVELVNETFERALQPPAGLPPRDDEISFRARDRLVPTRPPGASPACEILEDGEKGPAAARRAREARALAARIGALVSGAAGVAVRERGPGGEERPRRPRPGDVAILFRRLTQVAGYERALREAGIPFRLARGGGFYQAPEVRDLGELCASLSDPGDAVAWAALLRSPLCAVSDGALLRLARVGLRRLAGLHGRDLARALDGAVPSGEAPSPGASPPPGGEAEAPSPAGFTPGEWSRLLRFLGVWRELRDLRDRLPLDALLRRAVRDLDLEAAHLAAPEGERRAANVAKAVALGARLAAGGLGPAEMARHLRGQASRPPREPEAAIEQGDAVALLSVHQAKGLEWPIVMVPDLGAAVRGDTRRALLDGEGRLCAAWADRAREEFLEGSALRAAREAARRSESAESRRLLYVAMTRARDHLVLSGEGPARGESWRALVEAAASARPDLVRRVRAAEAGTAASGAPPDGDPPAPPAPVEPVAPPRIAARPAPRPIRIAVTDLAEWARCPRRHWLGRTLGIPEPGGTPGAGSGDDPSRATARGTLAHGLLADVDPDAPPLERRAQLLAAALRRGWDPAAPPVRRILAEVSRFADSASGRGLAAAARAGRLRREVPFLLRLDGEDGSPAVYLTGAIDALVVDARERAVTVVDYKYASPRHAAVERYRLQLVAYALAAQRAHPGARVEARLQFLRGDHRAVPVPVGTEELSRFAAEAPRIAGEVALGGGDVPPASLGRDPVRCLSEGCGWVGRCFPRGAVRPAGGAEAPPRAVAGPRE